MPSFMKNLYSNRIDFGLLLLRSVSGYMILVNHGYDKIVAGAEKWEKLGGAMARLGIDFFPVFWGFMAAFSESFAGAFLILGLFTIPASFLLSMTMFVAAYGHLVTGKGSPEMALIYGAVYLTLLVVGPGKFSLDWKFFKQE